MKSIKHLFLCLLASSTLSLAQAASISLSPASQSVTSGNAFSIDVLFNAEGSLTGLGAFDLDVSYDTALLSFSSASFGTGLDVLGLGSLQLATQNTGSINLFELSLDSAADLIANQAQNFKLATLTFNGLSSGNASFGLNINALADADGNTISAVPEPSTYLMLLAGLGLLGVSMKRRRA